MNDYLTFLFSPAPFMVVVSGVFIWGFGFGVIFGGWCERRAAARRKCAWLREQTALAREREALASDGRDPEMEAYCAFYNSLSEIEAKGGGEAEWVRRYWMIEPPTDVLQPGDEFAVPEEVPRNWYRILFLAPGETFVPHLIYRRPVGVPSEVRP